MLYYLGSLPDVTSTVCAPSCSALSVALVQNTHPQLLLGCCLPEDGAAPHPRQWARLLCGCMAHLSV